MSEWCKVEIKIDDGFVKELKKVSYLLGQAISYPFIGCVKALKRMRNIGIHFDWWDLLAIRFLMRFKLSYKAQAYIINRIDQGSPGRFERFRIFITRNIRKLKSLFIRKGA